jgi:predicted esterase
MSDLGFIHRFVPAQPDLPAKRTLLLLHGTGGDENQLLELGRALDPSAALLSPRGKILENGAPRFFRRLAEGVFDEEDVIARARELAGFIEAAASKYKIDLEKVVAVGYSNGANIAAAMMLLGVAPFSQAILLRPMVPVPQVHVPNLQQARVLLSGGQFDSIAQPQIVQKLGELFRRASAEVSVELQPGGHELGPGDVVTARKWLAAANVE